MKTFFFKLPVIASIILVIPAHSAFSQYLTKRHLTRGADTAEIFLNCEWYTDTSNITMNGIFYSIDNGKTLSIQRKANRYVENGMIFGDSVSGILYQAPLTSQDTFGVSFDYGVTFEKRYLQNIYITAAGCMAGEIYISGFGLYRGTDFGNNFTWQSNYYSLKLQDVGTLPGELYWIKNLGHNPFDLAYSNDYGQTYSLRQITLPGMPAWLSECDLHRGTMPGEFYIVAWKVIDTIAIFHSFDYGQTVELISYIPFGEFALEIWFTAGRTPGSFYYIQRGYCPPPNWHACLYINFSRDYGATFSTYCHDLHDLYTGVPQKEILQELNVFPNPAANKVIFRFGGKLPDNDSKITLYDLTGRAVADGRLPKGQTEVTLDTRSLAAGLYCYNVTCVIKSSISHPTTSISQKIRCGKLLITK